MRALLEELEERLRIFGAPVAGAFRPGLPPGRVRELLAAEGLGAPDDAVAWWGWHDGAGEAGAADGPGFGYAPDNTLVSPWHVLTLADALTIRAWRREEAPGLVPGGWVPLVRLTDKPAELAFDCAGTGRAAPLYVVDPDAGLPDPTPAPHFRSLADFVGSLLEAFDAGLVEPGKQDPRVPSLSWALEGDLRRLCWW